jgi:hypothetical protein
MRASVSARAGEIVSALAVVLPWECARHLDLAVHATRCSAPALSSAACAPSTPEAPPALGPGRAATAAAWARAPRDRLAKAR